MSRRDIDKNMETQAKIRCDKDEHKLYEFYADFNEWLESEEGQLLLDEYGINGLSQPSKAFLEGIKRHTMKPLRLTEKIAATKH
ncbi:hypothetical protein MGMO_164c00070 [Methyloglobulus morosus KoM1]|uniref:Uncharacterized protein n=1 Tax=Methyloglobulus morosus KoM1 TaxID=1116472 RepID=V5BMS5_9GAMM|nr:hypothetical protein [Methyloglobulus morosus]ESS67472.1 hypothetical protein MGMO_164c00070 [Methyloglobulus morosus KoM1]